MTKSKVVVIFTTTLLFYETASTDFCLSAQWLIGTTPYLRYSYFPNQLCKGRDYGKSRLRLPISVSAQWLRINPYLRYSYFLINCAGAGLRNRVASTDFCLSASG